MSHTSPALPLPEPHMWYTRQGAANVIGVSERTLVRMIERGTLRAYQPIGGPDETVPFLLWAPEVTEVAAARRRLRGSGGGD